MSDNEQAAAAAGRQEALNDAWKYVNALGGYFDPKDPSQVAYDTALGELIDHIERLGGRDPSLPRKH